MKDVRMETVPAKLTGKLVVEMEDVIKQGWYANKSELVRDAIRELIKKLKLERLENAIKEDINWGIHGK